MRLIPVKLFLLIYICMFFPLGEATANLCEKRGFQNHLKATVQVLGNYISVEEISKLMSKPYMLSAHPTELQHTINLLIKAYNIPTHLQESSFKFFSTSKAHASMKDQIDHLFNPPERDIPAFILFLFQNYQEKLFDQQEVKKLKATLLMLKWTVGTELLALTLQNFNKPWSRDFIEGLFATDPETLMEISRGLARVHLAPQLKMNMRFKNRSFFTLLSRPTTVGMIIWNYLDKISYIDQVKPFLKTLQLIKKHIPLTVNLQSEKENHQISGQLVLTGQVIQLLEVADTLSFANVLQDLSSLEQTFYRTMPQILIENNILDLIPSFQKQEAENKQIHEEMGQLYESRHTPFVLEQLRHKLKSG